MNARRKPLRWRRTRPDSRMFRITTTYELRRNGNVIMRAQSIDGGWFIYGLGLNTASAPVVTLEEAQAQAVAHVAAMADKHGVAL